MYVCITYIVHTYVIFVSYIYSSFANYASPGNRVCYAFILRQLIAITTLYKVVDKIVVSDINVFQVICICIYLKSGMRMHTYSYICIWIWSQAQYQRSMPCLIIYPARIYIWWNRFVLYTLLDRDRLIWI